MKVCAMLDLLLVNPCAADNIYGPLNNELTAIEPPLFCRLIAGYIRDREFSVEILDAEAERQGHHEVGQIVRDARPQLVCIVAQGHQPSSSTQQMVAAGLVAKAIKAQYDCPIVMVGGHVSALPERTLREEAVDCVGIGEGPITIEGLLLGEEWEQIPGLAWLDRVSRKYHYAEPAPNIEDLRQLHGHVWDLLPLHKYRAHQWQCLDDLSKRQPYASIYTSLNCPYRCSFCCISAPFGDNKYRMRLPDLVVDEIEYLYEEHGISTLKITDEMFVLAERHYTAICEGLIRRGLGKKLNLWAYARVDTVKRETLSLLRGAGIRWLALGIESASKEARDGAEKRLRTDDIVGVVKAVQGAGMNVIGNFMFGFRSDNLEAMRRTFDLAVECMPDWANFYSVMCYPGSALYAQAIKEGWALPATWSGYSQHSEDTRPLDTEHVSGAEVLAFRDQAFVDFFTHPSYLTHVMEKFGRRALDHVKAMTTHRLKRKLLETAA
jgi:anaerobic magnesium-protoporphyrin IX monomethyl ester cyclase